MIELPYSLIGRVVVIVAAIVLLLAIIILTASAFLFAWSRGFRAVSNLMWRGYGIDGPHPPLWKMRVSAVAMALSRFEFRKVRSTYHEAEQMVDNDVSFVKWAREVFIDE